MSKPDLADVLAEVNRLRAEHDIGGPLTEMPKGVMSRAFTTRPDKPASTVDTNTLLAPYGADATRFDHPKTLQGFVWAFDLGHYPELIEGTA